MKEQKGTRSLRLPKATLSTGAPSVPPTVLHVDDDPNDAALVRAAAAQAQVRFHVHHVEDGEQAVAYLSGAGIYADRERYPMPALILLDLKMPRTTGFDVLRWIRGQPRLGGVPVVVLSGSELLADMQQARTAGANSYVIKPLAFEALVKFIASLSTAWLDGRPLAQPRNHALATAQN